MRDRPQAKKLPAFVCADAEAYLWSGEPIAIDGQPVGELSLAGWSPKTGACVALGYVRGNAAQREHRATPVSIDLYVEAVGAKAWDTWPTKAG